MPTIIVLSIAIPSLTLIYSMDQHNDRPGERRKGTLAEEKGDGGICRPGGDAQEEGEIG